MMQRAAGSGRACRRVGAGCKRWWIARASRALAVPRSGLPRGAKIRTPSHAHGSSLRGRPASTASRPASRPASVGDGGRGEEEGAEASQDLCRSCWWRMDDGARLARQLGARSLPCPALPCLALSSLVLPAAVVALAGTARILLHPARRKYHCFPPLSSSPSRPPRHALPCRPRAPKHRPVQGSKSLAERSLAASFYHTAAAVCHTRYCCHHAQCRPPSTRPRSPRLVRAILCASPPPSPRPVTCVAFPASPCTCLPSLRLRFPTSCALRLDRLPDCTLLPTAHLDNSHYLPPTRPRGLSRHAITQASPAANYLRAYPG